ncbi:hypothetical protein BGX21_002633 [Mortierella sp. AD011]|nr:hypothetical protein BGX21_002633 [Mortierella sp. AD011]
MAATSESAKKSSVVIKVGMVGDSQIGKTSLMVKYVEGSFDEDYVQTLVLVPKRTPPNLPDGGTAQANIFGFATIRYIENTTAIPFLVGTKYDYFSTFSKEEQEEVTKQARKFARAMKAPLIFCSTAHSINVQKIFKIVLSKAFDLKCTIPEISESGAPILEYATY